MTSRSMPGRRRPDPLGMTVVYCAGAACSRPDLPVRERLREVIRGRDHGVLVSAPCLLGALGCPAGTGAGARGDGLVLVQPCDVHDREASGPAILVGPIRSDRDLDAICAWLRESPLDLDRLPANLRYQVRRPQPQLN